jgi:hypothetical protein
MDIVKLKAAEQGTKFTPTHRRSSEVDRKLREIMQIMKKRRNKFLLKPGDLALKRWDLVVLCLFAYTALVTPYEVTFMANDLGGMRLDPLFVINRCVDLLYLLDMLVQFNCAYEDADGCLIISRRAISARYMKADFLLDLLALLPYDLIQYFMNTGQFNTAQLRMLRMLRLLRLVRIVKLLNGNSVMARVQAQLQIPFALQSLYKFSVMLLVLLHWLACAWMLAAVTSGSGDFTGTWVEYTNMEQESIARRYFHSFYFAATLLISGTGPDTVPPQTVTEVGFATVMMIVGGFIYVYAVGCVCSITQNMDLPTKLFQQSVDTLNAYAEENKLPPALSSDVRRFLMQAKALHRQRFYDQTLSLISPKLLGQVNAKVHGAWLQKLMGYWKLEGISQTQMDTWSLTLVTKMKPRIYMPSEQIVVMDELPEHMYVIRRGLVARLGRIMSESSSPVFGEDVVLYRYRVRRNYSAHALTYVEVFSVGYEDVMETMGAEDSQFRLSMAKWARRLLMCRLLIQAAKDPEGLMRTAPGERRARRHSLEEDSAGAGGGQGQGRCDRGDEAGGEAGGQAPAIAPRRSASRLAAAGPGSPRAAPRGSAWGSARGGARGSAHGSARDGQSDIDVLRGEIAAVRLELGSEIQQLHASTAQTQRSIELVLARLGGGGGDSGGRSDSGDGRVSVATPTPPSPSPAASWSRQTTRLPKLAAQQNPAPISQAAAAPRAAHGGVPAPPGMAVIAVRQVSLPPDAGGGHAGSAGGAPENDTTIEF